MELALTATQGEGQAELSHLPMWACRAHHCCPSLSSHCWPELGWVAVWLQCHAGGRVQWAGHGPAAVSLGLTQEAAPKTQLGPLHSHPADKQCPSASLQQSWLWTHQRQAHQRSAATDHEQGWGPCGKAPSLGQH